MKLFYGKIKLPVLKTKKPLMTMHRGRTWDYGWNVFINGEMVKMWFDNSWGRMLYFEFNNQWYKMPMASELYGKLPEYDIDPTSIKQFHLTTNLNN